MHFEVDALSYSEFAICRGMRKLSPKSDTPPPTNATSPQSALDKYAECCEDLQSRDLLRQLPAFEPHTDFAHNDYLGLSKHAQVKAAAKQAIDQFGTGSTAARLLAGNLNCIVEFEEIIARDKGTEAALLFSSGFQANQSVLTALLDPAVLGAEPRVFSDRLNHASLHHGCFAAGARQHRYGHLDLNHLESNLKKHAGCNRPKFILTESLFGMDGDAVDIAALSQLAHRFGAFLYLDEAHATGVKGKAFYGLSGDAEAPVDMVMGTLGKALGSSGAFVACSAELKAYLVNRCAGFIYSTAPCPASIAAARCAWELVPSLNTEREIIDQHVNSIRAAAETHGWNLASSSSQILPLIVGDAKKVVDIGEQMQAAGVRVSAIRPPTVPVGTSRIRLAISSLHSQDDVQKLIDVLGPLLDRPS